MSGMQCYLAKKNSEPKLNGYELLLCNVDNSVVAVVTARPVAGNGHGFVFVFGVFYFELCACFTFPGVLCLV